VGNAGLFLTRKAKGLNVLDYALQMESSVYHTSHLSLGLERINMHEN
jgi:hypothetical protein